MLNAEERVRRAHHMLFLWLKENVLEEDRDDHPIFLAWALLDQCFDDDIIELTDRGRAELGN